MGALSEGLGRGEGKDMRLWMWMGGAISVGWVHGERRCWLAQGLDGAILVERTILGDGNGAGKLRRGYMVRSRGRARQEGESLLVKCAGRGGLCPGPGRSAAPGSFVNARDDVAMALGARCAAEQIEAPHGDCK